MPETTKVLKGDLKRVFDETQPGTVRSGVIGTPPPAKEVEETPAPTPEEETEAKVLRALLTKWVKPPRLSSRSMPEEDMRSFLRKVKGQSLQDLRRFFEVEVPEEIKAEIAHKWKDISP